MDEEKQLENPQSAAEISEPVERVENEPMSTETNLPIDVEGTSPESVAVPEASLETEGGYPSEAEEIEPFDLSPEASDAASESSEGVDAASAEQLAAFGATIEEMTQRLEAVKTQLDDRVNQYARLSADFDNYRKRTQREKEEQEQQIKCNTLKELLPVVDNFERARSQIKPVTDSEMTIHKSYQGVYKDLVDRLKKIGVAPMRAEGEPFDPNLHEAVMREETDAYAEGTVIEELRRGYVLGDQVLRHAMVKVATAPEGASAAVESSEAADS